MPNNILICYVCKNPIKNRDEASYVGKDEMGKEKYRHRTCSSKLKHEPWKVRKTWLRNPKTKVKESDKLYNRKKDKQKIRKEYESD